VRCADHRIAADPDGNADWWNHTVKPTWGIIGAGKVGTVLARLYHAQGGAVNAVYSRSQARALGLAEQVGAQACETPQAVVDTCDLTLVTVSDDALAPVADALAHGDWVGKAIIHTSGAHSSAVLQPLAACGAAVGSLHPSYPFADVDGALVGLRGATFGVEAADERLRGWLMAFVASLDGRAIVLNAESKALYHAALVMASNYSVTLYALAERLLLTLGADRDAITPALNALMAGTVRNLGAQGIPNALTGPLVRGDVGTIAAHLQALAQADAQAHDVYKQLARLTYPLMAARGVPTEPIERLFTEEGGNATIRP
jgi:predicted short-subunit dehydrogenase-like oxidoreductase (DUF2520 family)